MTFRSIFLAVLTMIMAVSFPLQAFPAGKKPVTPSQHWSGSVNDLSLLKAAPEFIISAKELEKLWHAWQVQEPLPKVDFSKNLIVVATTRGSVLRLAAALDEKGNLQVGGVATMDLRPGFRYVIAVVSREGVKTVNGKDLAVAAPNPASTPAPAADIGDFGVTDIEVRSVKSLNVDKDNQEIAAASKSGKAWPQQAVLVALKFTGEGLRGHTKIIEVRTPAEKKDAATITVAESGYLDDAIGGERWRLWLQKSANGVWTIQRALWAQLCNRPGHKFYAAEKCP
jgi:hypothetical protein